MISLIAFLTSNFVSRYGLRILFGVLLFSSANWSYGQERIDTSVLEPEFVYEKENSFKSVFYGQPGKAALYSLIAPGGGQLYNKRWWKVPLVWAGEGYLIYNLIGSIQNFKNWDNCRLSFLDPDLPSACDPVVHNLSPMVTVTNVSDAFDRQQTAKAAKERAWLFVIAAHLIQTLEAFVDRHLINFNTEEQLTFSTNPQPELEINNFSSSSITVFSVNINLNRLAD